MQIRISGVLRSGMAARVAPGVGVDPPFQDGAIDDQRTGDGPVAVPLVAVSDVDEKRAGRHGRERALWFESDVAGAGLQQNVMYRELADHITTLGDEAAFFNIVWYF